MRNMLRRNCLKLRDRKERLRVIALTDHNKFSSFYIPATRYVHYAPMDESEMERANIWLVEMAVLNILTLVLAVRGYAWLGGRQLQRR